MRLFAILMLCASVASADMAISHGGLTSEQLRGTTVNVEQVSSVVLAGFDAELINWRELQ